MTVHQPITGRGDGTHIICWSSLVHTPGTIDFRCSVPLCNPSETCDCFVMSEELANHESECETSGNGGTQFCWTMD